MNRDRLFSRPAALAIQLAMLAVVLVAWEVLPDIEALRDRAPVFDPFFVSSPTRVYEKLLDLCRGENNTYILDYLRPTLWAFVVGTTIGIVGGVLAGLLLSNSARANQVLRPALVLINAVPRVALIPIFVIIWGPTFASSVATSLMVVFFIVFFNAYEGGRSVRPELIANARLLGAKDRHVLYRIRLPHAVAWTFAALPNAVTYGLITVVTAEIFTGYAGIGRLLVISVTAVDSSLTFAVVVILAVVGLVLVGATELARTRFLRWQQS